MSRIHPIAGQISAAERYEVYRERTRAAQQAERELRTRRKARQQAIAAYEESEHEQGNDSKQRRDRDQNRNDGTGIEDLPADEFGKHYA